MHKIHRFLTSFFFPESQLSAKNVQIPRLSSPHYRCQQASPQRSLFTLAASNTARSFHTDAKKTTHGCSNRVSSSLLRSAQRPTAHRTISCAASSKANSNGTLCIHFILTSRSRPPRSASISVSMSASVLSGHRLTRSEQTASRSLSPKPFSADEMC